MKRSYLFLLAAVLVVGFAWTGCASKKPAGGADQVAEETAAPMAPDLEPAAWEYDQEPKPAVVGTPDYRLVSFGFDQHSVLMKPEGRGACREAIQKLADQPEARLVVIGFADGIHEKRSAGSLGMRRAHSAAKVLEGLGIAKERIQTTSFGDTYSTARDFETIKQSRERKVEVWVLK
jgi:outer membrane protein OmpA-like peptidoglycan-associated protein